MSPDQQPTLKYVNEGDICAEIGVMKGDYSAQILKRKPKELHLIDPWVHQDYEKNVVFPSPGRDGEGLPRSQAKIY